MGQDGAGAIGYQQISDIGLLSRFGQQHLQSEIAPVHHTHHSGAGAGLKSANQGGALFNQQLGAVFFFAVDILYGQKRENWKKYGDGTDNNPRRDA